jgi:hypothetical protein
MSGKFVTSTRTFTRPEFKAMTGYVGQAGSPTTVTYPVNAPTQTTYSWRTNAQEVGDDEIPDSDLRTTRNGFTTYDPETDKGHEFWSRKQSFHGSLTPEVYALGQYGSKQLFYRGPLIPKVDQTGDNAGITFPSVARMSASEIATFGQRAIQNCAPTSPQASAATFLGELHEGLPSGIGTSLWREGTHVARGAGSEYLNVQFGWLPMIKDIRKAVSALQRTTTIIRQLQRDNGRVVRRRFAFPETVTVEESSFYGLNGPYYGVLYGDQYLSGTARPVNRMVRTSRSVWFSGAFSYSIPTDSSVMSKVERYSSMANVLLGARVTPEVLWQLAPWSWLVDWKLSIGSLLGTASLTSSDGLVIRYGYLMAHTVRDETYMVGSNLDRFGHTIPACSINFRSEVKERVRATPFGFGMNPASFTGKQWAILAALGMSRTPR